MSIGDLIRGSLRKVGAIDPGEGPTAQEYADAIETVNRMLYSWSTIYGVHKQILENFTLSSGTSEYTYGSGGDFDSERPMRILECYIRDNQVDIPVIETSFKNYADIGDKDLESYPQVFLHNQEYPLSKLIFWPVPDDDYPIYFQAVKPLGQYSTKADDLNLPPEYEEAVEYNLAVRLAPEYQVRVPNEVVALAAGTFRQLKSLHAQVVPQIRTSLDTAKGRYNIYEDE